MFVRHSATLEMGTRLESEQILQRTATVIDSSCAAGKLLKKTNCDISVFKSHKRAGMGTRAVILATET